MSISMQAIAVLEALVILCLLLLITRRHQTAAFFAGVDARVRGARNVQSKQTRVDAKHAHTAREAMRSGRFDTLPNSSSGSTGQEPRRGTANQAAAGDSQLASTAGRSSHARVCPTKSVATMRFATADRADGAENAQGTLTEAAPQANAEQYFLKILASLPFAVLLLDARGMIRTVNLETARLFRYEADELIGKPAALLVPECGAGADASTCPATLAQPQSAHAAQPHELSARRKDGTEFRAEISLHPFPFDEGATLAFVIDRTDRYELHRNRLDLAHLMRVSTMGQLASSLAHELNQPLTAILSNVQAAQRFMAADPIDLAEVREILNDIVQDDYRASEVIRRIRAVVKKGELEVVPLDLAAVVRDAVHLLRSDAIVRGTRVTLDLASDLPQVHADKVQLQQVMLNLLLNAFDAMNDIPPVDRAVHVSLTAAEHHSVCLAVSDRGHGLTSDKLDKIFKPFVTSKPQGLGLGLSISRTIIDMHRGRLWAETNSDRGATFYVTLPAGEANSNMLREQ
jgi:two-component system, LuxR family, sensor kinase FixL